MTALGINVTSNEPETSANLPSGRLNLKGQQKPKYLIDAIEAEKKAWHEFVECPFDPHDGVSSFLDREWQKANTNKINAYARYNQECANG